MSFASAWQQVGPFLARAGLPIGAMVVGVAAAALGYLAFAWLSRQAALARPPPFPFRRVPSPTATDVGRTDAAVVEPVRMSTREGTEVVWIAGPGPQPPHPVPRARGYMLALLLAFVGTAIALLATYGRLFGAYDFAVGWVGTFLYWPLPWPGVYAVSRVVLVVPDFIFPMYLAAFAGFAIASGLLRPGSGHSTRRRGLALAVLLGYVAAEFVLDALFFTVPGATLRNLALLVRSLVGGLFLALFLFTTFYLPPAIRRTERSGHRPGARARFVAVAGVSVVLPAAALLAANDYLGLQPLLFGVTLLLLLPLAALVTFGGIGQWLFHRRRIARPPPSVAEYHPSVSVLVPAYNEEEWIEEAVAAADRASRRYPGRVEIIVANDGSTDRTQERALRAITGLRHARGILLDLRHGGKSHALNSALAIASGEIVLRCDGDTAISDVTGFATIVPHFADPQVGGVQGAVHPRQRDGWTRKLRGLEISWNHYFLRPAGIATESAEVLDGLFSAFRRQELIDAGGWVAWNGEDSEISIRLQRMGFEIRIEFGAVAYEDVPPDYNALRKQRVRWGRGILMANGRHYPALLGENLDAGGWGIFFWLLMFVHSGVRSLTYVFLLLLIAILGVPALLDAAVLLLVGLGLRAVPLAVGLVRMRRADLLPWIPLYPVFSLLKQTYRYEAFGTIGPHAAPEFS